MQTLCPVRYVSEVAENIFVLGFSSGNIAGTILPGQFVNIKVTSSTEPLLRRPFSVYRTDGDTIEIIFNVVGRGTDFLRNKRPGELLDVLGPLGVPFGLTTNPFDTAILVAGGLGVAPFPLATKALLQAGKAIVSIVGARSQSQIVDAHLVNTHVATDDGSRGKRGNVVELLQELLDTNAHGLPMVFGCGPTAMLRALSQVVKTRSIPCEVSLEGPMGCGFGICQGCPVEIVGDEKTYKLMCKDGPTFNVNAIVL